MGLDDIPLEAPVGEIFLDFPRVELGRLLTSKVIGWNPGLDIAILEINIDLPQQVFVSNLSKYREIATHQFRVYGFPQGRDYGIWSFGKILGENARGYVQIELDTAYAVQQGFSGSLVWDAVIRQIVGIIIETDINAPETKTAYFLPVNSILEIFPYLETVHPQDDGGVKYACFISYPNDIGKQGQLVREFAEAIYDALSVELGGMIDLPIFFDREHITDNGDIAQALCESACFMMVFTPKYFSERRPLCTLEFKAMQELELSRLHTANYPGDLSFIIPVRPYSQDVLPMSVIGQRRDYDFHDMTVSGNLRAHPQYGPLVRKIAEHIYRCYLLLENCEEDPCCECSEFHLPDMDQVRDLFPVASPRRFSRFPTR